MSTVSQLCTKSRINIYIGRVLTCSSQACFSMEASGLVRQGRHSSHSSSSHDSAPGTGHTEVYVSIWKLPVPYKGVGCCLGPEGNGVSRGEEGEVGPGPPDTREISSLAPARKEVTWSRRKKERGPRHDEEDPACTEWALLRNPCQCIQMLLSR